MIRHILLPTTGQQNKNSVWKQKRKCYVWHSRKAHSGFDTFILLQCTSGRWATLAPFRAIDCRHISSLRWYCEERELSAGGGQRHLECDDEKLSSIIRYRTVSMTSLFQWRRSWAIFFSIVYYPVGVTVRKICFADLPERGLFDFLLLSSIRFYNTTKSRYAIGEVKINSFQ